MLISYNEACAKDCSTLEQDLELCERAGFDCIELRLDMLRVSSREYAQAAMTIVDADRRWVSQIQSVYRALYSQLDRSAGGCSGGRQAAAPEAAAVVRDVISAGTLMEDVKRTIHLQPELASYLHSRRGQAELHRLLK